MRFILCQATDNPVLALFSGNQEKVFASYDTLRETTDLLDEISSYFWRIMNYYGEEFANMYTEKDFLRDHPQADRGFVFPWEEEYHKQRLQEEREEEREEERKATALLMRDMGLAWDLITQITGLNEEQIRALSQPQNDNH